MGTEQNIPFFGYFQSSNISAKCFQIFLWKHQFLSYKWKYQVDVFIENMMFSV